MGIKSSFQDKDLLPEKYLGTYYDKLQLILDNLHLLDKLDLNVIGTLKKYLGNFVEAPLTRPGGEPLENGDQYFNVTTNKLFILNGDHWEDYRLIGLSEDVIDRIQESEVTVLNSEANVVALNSAIELVATEIANTKLAVDSALIISNENVTTVVANKVEVLEALDTIRDFADSVAALNTATTEVYENTLLLRDAAEAASVSANSSKEAAGISESNSAISEGNALNSENKAKQWAEESVDTEVEAGQYSALHHATKASENAALANQSAIDSENSNVASDSARIASEAARDASEGFRDQASTFASNASGSASAASTAATTATDAATFASGKASEASQSAIDAKASEDGAVSAANQAMVSASAASTAQGASELVLSDVQAINVSVSTAEQNALQSANLASQKATESSVSATQSQQFRDEALAHRDSSAASATEATEAKNIAVQAASSLTNGMSMVGDWDASTGTPPTPLSGSVFYKIVAPGVIEGESYAIGDNIVFNPSSSAWFKIDNTESVSSVAGKTGNVNLELADIAGVGTAASANTEDFATAAQGALASSAIQPTDSRLSDAREWTADTVTQAEAEEGSSTTRRAWTSQRVRQAVNAVVNAIGNATTTVKGWMSPEDKTKLNGIATGATKNATNAQLRDRATHTGTQAISTVSGLQTALDGKSATGHTHAYVPTSRTVNGKVLSANISLTAADVGLGNVRNVSSYSQGESDSRYLAPYATSYTLKSASQVGYTNMAKNGLYAHLRGGLGSANLTFDQAIAEAASLGVRLPTVEEMEAEIVKGTGGGFDSDQCWTSTAVPGMPGYVYTVRGDGAAGTRTPANTDGSVTAMTRYVANVDVPQITASLVSGLSNAATTSVATIRSGTTKANVGLGNVQNVDQTNASNLSSGTVPNARISGSYTGLASLTGSGNVDFARFLGNASDTVSAPSYSWTGDTNTGIYRPAADQVAITTGGVQRALFSSAGISGDGSGLTGTATLRATGTTKADVGLGSVDNYSRAHYDDRYAAKSHTHSYVPTSRTVNSKALSANISLTAADVGAAASSHNHSAANITSGTLAGARLPNATATVQGAVKVRLNGTTAYFTTNGDNA